MIYEVIGRRTVDDEEKRFSAPTRAESAEEAKESFLNGVSEPSEFDVEAVKS